MKKIITITCVFFLTLNMFALTNYYVSPTGSNSNNGLSTSAPFKTVTYAATIATHGDVINVMAGTYSNTTYGTWNIWKTEQTVRINNKNSTSGNYLVIKPYGNGNVKFKGDGNYIFQIRNSSYIRVEGFEIEGEAGGISLSTALQYQFTYKDSNGVVQERVPAGTPDSVIATMTFPILTGTTRPSVLNSDAFIVQGSHHIDVINNNIHHSPSDGLRIADSDYINIKNNVISNCNTRTSVGTPALVLSFINSIDTNDGVKIVISGNKVYDNYNLVYSWNAAKDFINPIIDEGKGISLEHCITRDPTQSSWNHGRVRIENNICYGNGFSGINTNEAERVDIINNTCYQNIASGRGENTGISINDAIDATVVNNISVSVNSFGGKALAIRNLNNCVVKNNVVLGAIDDDVDSIDVNTIFSDPLFVDQSVFNFKLQSSSPAINAGITTNAPLTDFLGVTRTGNPDAGAYEYVSGARIANDLKAGVTENEIVVYPNPTSSFVNVKNLNADFKLMTIQGVDVTGKLKSKMGQANSVLDMSGLSEGVYLLKTDKETKRIIKN